MLYFWRCSISYQFEKLVCAIYLFVLCKTSLKNRFRYFRTTVQPVFIMYLFSRKPCILFCMKSYELWVIETVCKNDVREVCSGCLFLHFSHLAKSCCSYEKVKIWFFSRFFLALYFLLISQVFSVTFSIFSLYILFL